MSVSKILIVGQGIAGPALATFLLLSPLPAKDKPRITILERSPSLRSQGQNIDLRTTGVTLIRHLGLETIIRQSTTKEEGVQFVDSQNNVRVAGPADKTGRTQTGTMEIEILRGRLGEILYERCKAMSEDVKRKGGHGVEFIYGDSLAELEQLGDAVRVTFVKDKRPRVFDLVVGADGLLSKTRRLAFSGDGEVDKNRLESLGMHGAYFSMPSTETDSLWRRWYQIPGRRSIMIRPSTEKNKVTCFMAVFHQDKDSRFDEVAKDGRNRVKDQMDLMAEYFRGAGWETERVLREMYASDDFYYSVTAQVKMPRFSKGRVVLLGDAGYCASPISGQGTTLALNGAYHLAGALLQKPGDHEAALRQYEAKMRPIVEEAQELPLGGRAQYVLWPETALGIWCFQTFFWLVQCSKLPQLVAMFKGPQAAVHPVEDYGLQKCDEIKVFNQYTSSQQKEQI